VENANHKSGAGAIGHGGPGFPLPHEHLIDSSAGIRNKYYEPEFRDEALEMALASFTGAKSRCVS
jgi:hypothetical protein